MSIFPKLLIATIMSISSTSFAIDWLGVWPSFNANFEHEQMQVSTSTKCSGESNLLSLAPSDDRACSDLAHSETQQAASQSVNIQDHLGKEWVLPAGENIVIRVGSDQDVPSVSVAIDAISSWIIPLSSRLTLQLAAGRTKNRTVVWSHPYGDRITIAGEKSKRIKPVRLVSASGSANNWITTIEFSHIENTSVGDYILCFGTAGTGHHEALRGVYPVVKVSGNKISVRNTGWYKKFPALNLTGGDFVHIKTVLHFDDVDGFVVRGSHLGALRDLVIEGNSDDYWSSARVASTEKGTHGILVGGATLNSTNPVSLLKQPGNALGVGASSASLDAFVGVFGFDQQGIAVGASSSIYASYSAASNNRRRGYYADGSSQIFAKNLSAGGNYLDGVIGDNASNIVASSNSAAVGNGGFGVFSQNGSMVDFGTGIIKANISGGLRVQNGSTVQTTNAIYSPAGVAPGSDGVVARNGGTAILDGADVDGFKTGISASSGGNVRALSVLSVKRSTICGVRAETGSNVTIAKLDASDNAVDFLNTDLSTLLIGGVPIPPSWTSLAGLANLKIVNGQNDSVISVEKNADLSLATNGRVLVTINFPDGSVFPSTSDAHLGSSEKPWASVTAIKTSLSASTLSAHGLSQETAPTLMSSFNAVIEVVAGGGVKLSGSIGERQEVWNSSSADLKVYPPSGARIYPTGINAAAILRPGSHGSFVAFSAEQWYQSP